MESRASEIAHDSSVMLVRTTSTEKLAKRKRGCPRYSSRGIYSATHNLEFFCSKKWKTLKVSYTEEKP